MGEVGSMAPMLAFSSCEHYIHDYASVVMCVSPSISIVRLVQVSHDYDWETSPGSGDGAIA